MDKEDPIVEVLVRVHEKGRQMLVGVLSAIVQSVLWRLEPLRELGRWKLAIRSHRLHLSGRKVFRHDPPHARLQLSLEVGGIGLSIRLVNVTSVWWWYRHSQCRVDLRLRGV